MIAIQYSFVLPADYDMTIIRNRVRDKGHVFDNHPGLIFKAFLAAEKKGPRTENVYAPFYLWGRPDGVTGFLTGDRFAGLSQAFGWPNVDTWLALDTRVPASARRAAHALRRIRPVAPYADLAALAASLGDRATGLMDRGAAGVVTALDPYGWRSVEFSLWEAPPPDPDAADATVYEVLHLSPPGVG